MTPPSPGLPRFWLCLSEQIPVALDEVDMRRTGSFTDGADVFWNGWPW